MGKTSRKKYTPEFKAQVAIEALKEKWSLAELAVWGTFAFGQGAVAVVD